MVSVPRETFQIKKSKSRLEGLNDAFLLLDHKLPSKNPKNPILHCFWGLFFTEI